MTVGDCGQRPMLFSSWLCRGLRFTPGSWSQNMDPAWPI